MIPPAVRIVADYGQRAAGAQQTVSFFDKTAGRVKVVDGVHAVNEVKGGRGKGQRLRPSLNQGEAHRPARGQGQHSRGIV